MLMVLISAATGTTSKIFALLVLISKLLFVKIECSFLGRAQVIDQWPLQPLSLLNS
jgi:hypothetical protein